MRPDRSKETTPRRRRVVPNTTSAVLVCITNVDEGEPVVVVERPIIAWRFEGSDPSEIFGEPITIEPPDEGEWRLIRFGSVLFQPSVATYESVEAAIEKARESHRAIKARRERS